MGHQSNWNLGVPLDSLRTIKKWKELITGNSNPQSLISKNAEFHKKNFQTIPKIGFFIWYRFLSCKGKNQ